MRLFFFPVRSRRNRHRICRRILIQPLPGYPVSHCHIFFFHSRIDRSVVAYNFLIIRSQKRNLIPLRYPGKRKETPPVLHHFYFRDLQRVNQGHFFIQLHFQQRNVLVIKILIFLRRGNSGGPDPEKTSAYPVFQNNTLDIRFRYPFPRACLYPVFPIPGSLQHKPLHIQPFPGKPDKSDGSLLRELHHQPMLRLSRFIGTGPAARAVFLPICRQGRSKAFLFHTVCRHPDPGQPGEIFPVKSMGFPRSFFRFCQVIPPQSKGRQQKEEYQQNTCAYLKKSFHTNSFLSFIFYYFLMLEAEKKA